MKTIRNKTAMPVRVPLPRGKVLHLGPHMDGEIADNAVEHAALLKLVKAGSIEILGDGERSLDSGKAGTSSVPEQTHGRGKSTIRSSGER